MSDNGIGMNSAPNSEPAGAVTSREATKKHPKQGKFVSGVRKEVKIDVNKHGIRRETSIGPKTPKRTGRKKV